MLSILQLNRNIDSLQKVSDSFSRKLKIEVAYQLKNISSTDSALKKAALPQKKIKSVEDFVPDSLALRVFESAINITNGLKNTYQFTGSEWQLKKQDTRQGEIEWHRKFALSMSCLVLFFIGAPLGSIIRKGGLGMPLVIAIIFFIIFHLLNIFGEKFAKEAITSVWFGMWLSVIVLVPVGAFLTYKAMHDSQLFNKEFYNRSFKKIGQLSQPLVNRLSRKQ